MQRAFLLISLGLALTACSADEGDEGIFFSKNVAPGDNCSFSANENEKFLTHGTMTLAGGSYAMFPQLISKITSGEDNVQQRTILARGARVDVEFLDPDISIDDSLLHFESRFTAPITPNGGVTDAQFVGLSTDFIAAMRAKYGGDPAFETEVLIKAVVYGDLAGSEVTSQKFEFPVTVCTSCVLNNLGTCPLPAGTVVQSAPGTCSLYQDGYQECCTGAAGQLVCPATVATPPASFTLAVTLASVGTVTATGVVTSAPAGITCGGDCTQSYVEGTVVTLTATPDAGNNFVGWSGNCVGTTPTCMVTMDAAKNTTATFTKP